MHFLNIYRKFGEKFQAMGGIFSKIVEEYTPLQMDLFIMLYQQKIKKLQNHPCIYFPKKKKFNGKTLNLNIFKNYQNSSIGFNLKAL